MLDNKTIIFFTIAVFCIVIGSDIISHFISEDTNPVFLGTLCIVFGTIFAFLVIASSGGKNDN